MKNLYLRFTSFFGIILWLPLWSTQKSATAKVTLKSGGNSIHAEGNTVEAAPKHNRQKIRANRQTHLKDSTFSVYSIQQEMYSTLFRRSSS